MAEIFLARSVTGAGVERMVVLKRVLRHAAMDETLVKLFVQEARLAAQLQHPNVVQVYDVGKLGSSYFFSMEYVHGETVRDLLLYARHQNVRLPIATVMTIAAGAAAGLHHAHDRRGMHGRPLDIVHSDVSPSNLMITREGVVKVVDFGIAKAEHQQAEVERPMQGKLCYMSPEQVRSQPLDRRSDLFSLGIVLWELLTLQGLYRAESDFNVMDQIINHPPPAPSQLRPDVPLDIDEIVLRLLAKNPANRYQTAADLLDAIEGAAMRMSTLLSTASVARQMREWFGVKPEPWIEQTVGGSIKRVVVNAEPVPKDLGQTIAGPIGGIDEVLDTMPPTQTKPPTHEGGPSWDRPTIEDLESIRDRLFREVRERKSPQPEPQGVIVDSRQARDDAPPPPAPMHPPQSTWQQPMGHQPMGHQPPVWQQPVAPPSAPWKQPGGPTSIPRAPVPHRTLAAEDRRSAVPMVLLAIVITGGIGIGGFALLWKTLAPSKATRSDAGASVSDSLARAPATGLPTPPIAPPVDAGVAPNGAELAGGGSATTTTTTTQPAKAKSTKSIATLFAAQDYAGTVSACLEGPPANMHRASCAIAACGVRDAPHAKRWLDSAPASERPGIIHKCGERGVSLAPLTDKPAHCDTCLE